LHQKFTKPLHTHLLPFSLQQLDGLREEAAKPTDSLFTNYELVRLRYFKIMRWVKNAVMNNDEQCSFVCEKIYGHQMKDDFF